MSSEYRGMKRSTKTGNSTLIAQHSALCAPLCALVLALCTPAAAQQSEKIVRIGFLGGMSATAFGERMGIFRQLLRELGYSEGKNIVFEERWADGRPDRLAHLASELVGHKPDVLVTFGGAAPAHAAKKATATIPVVMAAGGSDPAATGLVASLARPGANITGMANIFTDLRGKQMEMLKETIPKLSRVAVLWNPDSPAGDRGFRSTEAEAHKLKLRFQSLEVRNGNDFQKAFEAAKQNRAGAVLVTANPLIFTHFARIADLAIKQRVPTIQSQKEFLEVGGLMMYGPNEGDIYRRAAIYVDKIIKGAKPADLPIERPTKFQLLINLKTAQQIGLTIPPNVLARADRVIK
jgi:putative ABC transport system substrate-binding protein